MKHYEIAQWVDFARASVPEADRAAMQDHLTSGCSQCRQVVDFFEKLAVACRSMAEFQVPDSAVHTARELFRSWLPQRPKRVLRVPVELIFDSFLVPSPVGLRATWQVGWQALYRAGDCSVDVRVEPDFSSSRVAVIGQISNHVQPEVEMPDIPVRLKFGKLVVAETRSNRFGEFQMEYEQQGRLHLHIDLDGGAKRLHLPLKSPAVEKQAGTARAKAAPAGRRKSATEG